MIQEERIFEFWPNLGSASPGIDITLFHVSHVGRGGITLASVRMSWWHLLLS